ncbi:hypothetical protein ACH46_19250 [Gordonia phthalatica]|uniref:Uncharacterized protein n=1 Tax=Gordonia phthalatica TaxID=1136941 RepID=A0A0N9NCN3_9ACTN|nr:hypothetical protein ACH46_19250 [Gordonia phthalatica]AUH67308.1 hypothetical protein CXX93_01715 [Gordonia sp. YC-JH1]
MGLESLTGSIRERLASSALDLVAQLRGYARGNIDVSLAEEFGHSSVGSCSFVRRRSIVERHFDCRFSASQQSSLLSRQTAVTRG